MLCKRLKYGIKDINLLAFTPLSSLLSSIKAFKDKANSRRKTNSRIRVTLRELNEFIAIKKGVARSFFI